MISQQMFTLMATAIMANCRVTRLKLTDDEARRLAAEIAEHEPNVMVGWHELYQFLLSGNANFLGATIVVRHEQQPTPENWTIH